MRADRRIFFALWPRPEVAAVLHEQGRQLRRLCGGRVMREETLHLTLAFIGDVEASRIVEAQGAVEDVALPAPFTLQIDRLGRFERGRLIWAGSQDWPAELIELGESLQMALAERGFILEPQPFRPHVTLLREPRHPDADSFAWAAVSWQVEDLVLVESCREGPSGHRYEMLARWPLAGAGTIPAV